MARNVPGIATSRKRLRDAELNDLGLTALFTSEGILKDTSMSEVVIERYYPDKMMGLGIYRSTYKTANPIYTDPFKISVPILSKSSYDIWIPQGTDEICPRYGWNSRVPDDEIVGIIEAVDGDNRSKDLILVDYVKMADNVIINFDMDYERVIKVGSTVLKLKDDEINITSDKIIINGDITVTGDVDITGNVKINDDDINQLISEIKAHIGS